MRTQAAAVRQVSGQMNVALIPRKSGTRGIVTIRLARKNPRSRDKVPNPAAVSVRQRSQPHHLRWCEFHAPVVKPCPARWNP